MSDFIPETDLERSIVSAQSGESSIDALIATLFSSEIVALLDRALPESGELGAAQPLAFKMTDGNPGVALFTSMTRAPKDVEGFTHAIQTKASWILSELAPGIGIVVNPGLPCGFELPPDGVAKAKSNFASTTPRGT